MIRKPYKGQRLVHVNRNTGECTAFTVKWFYNHPRGDEMLFLVATTEKGRAKIVYPADHCYTPAVGLKMALVLAAGQEPTP